MRIALYQPDIPQNTGTLLRLAACLGVALDIIEPAGFRLDDRALKRAGMDYLDLAALTRHRSWDAFEQDRTARGGRLVLFTTRATASHIDFSYHPDDVLLFGRESAGAPEHVHQAADARLRIPMVGEARSLNLAVSAAIALGEALRQVDGFPAG
ncbi:MAG: tRNA methyltransferase [Hyphomicrobiales bacterium]|nr:MAG: tRNA methyltransferase [Hyphomicrobiales bacterium]